MRTKIIMLFIILTTSNAFANDKGIGYITKTETIIYTDSTGSEKDEVLKPGLPLLAWEARSILSGKVAAESISDGRAHVRYWKNGVNSEDGENTGWVDPKSVKRFAFDCCGDSYCSGIKPRIFTSTTYSDCFNIAFDEVKEKTNY